MNDIADQPLSNILTGDNEQLHTFHATMTKMSASSFDDLTITVSKNVRTVTVLPAANAATVSPSQTDSIDVQSAIPQADASQEPVSKMLDTTALAAALPRAGSTTSGSAFAGYNFSTAFTKSETGQSLLKCVRLPTLLY